MATESTAVVFSMDFAFTNIITLRILSSSTRTIGYSALVDSSYFTWDDKMDIDF